MKKRFIALTDIYRKPDDKQSEIDDVESMIRLLLYANEIDLEALIPASSMFYAGGKEEDVKVVHDIIDAYEQVKPNLDIHAEGYPSADYLRSITVPGIVGTGYADAKYNDNPGVNRIIEVVDREDERPVWVGLWCGCNTLAQAVWKVSQTRSQAELNKFLSKLRVYGISDQDKSGIWLRRTYGDRLFYIVSPSGGNFPSCFQFMFSTWQGISIDGMSKSDKPKKGYRGARKDLVTKEWLTKNIYGQSPYRKLYPMPTVLMEGDTPSYLGLIPNGLNDMDHPDYGGWGGRYQYGIPPKAPFLGKKELYPIWYDSKDTIELADGSTETSNFATIWRWREGYQHDFAARMLWTETPEYKDANHPPVVKLNMPNELTVKVGEKVTLSAEGSYDPDGDALTYKWYNYKEAGNYSQVVKAEKSDQAVAAFPAPNSACTLHFILELRDNGTPALTRYARVIVHVTK